MPLLCTTQGLQSTVGRQAETALSYRSLSSTINTPSANAVTLQGPYEGVHVQKCAKVSNLVWLGVQHCIHKL